MASEATEFRLFEGFLLAELSKWGLDAFVESVKVSVQGLQRTVVVPGSKRKPRMSMETLAKRVDAKYSPAHVEPKITDGYYNRGYLYDFRRPDTTIPTDPVGPIAWMMSPDQFTRLYYDKGKTIVEIAIVVAVELAIHEAMEMVVCELKGPRPSWKEHFTTAEDDDYQDATEAKLEEYKTTLLWPHDRTDQIHEWPRALTKFTFLDSDEEQMPCVAF